jgi:tetratricopeptide (TPR) repeat protein
MTDGTNQPDENKLRENLKDNPADWESRKQLAHLLYDRGSFVEAADIVWEVEEIPSIDVELAFAARILAKARPRKAIRLLTALLEHNQGRAVQNLGLANALLHHGMVLQAARFYGAALEADPELGNPELEHFLLWTDDEETLWGNFNNRRPVLGDLPWMKRDPMEALKLTSRVNTHTTPVKLPGLKPAPGEDLKNDFYQQKAEKGADPTPPPAVTIPLDRVAPKDRLFDDELGAPTEQELPGMTNPAPPPKKELAKPDFAAAGAAKPQPVTTIPSPPMSPPPGMTLPPPAAAGAPKMAPPPTIPLPTRPKPSLPPLKKPDAP